MYDDTEKRSTYQYVQYFVWLKIHVLSFINELMQRIFNCGELQNTSLIPQKGLHIWAHPVYHVTQGNKMSNELYYLAIYQQHYNARSSSKTQKMNDRTNNMNLQKRGRHKLHPGTNLT